MNYSDSMKRKRTKRKVFAVTLAIGLLLGFVFGRLSAVAVQTETSTAQDDLILTAHAEETSEPLYLGEYRITAYCACEKCCGIWANNRPGGKVIGAAGKELVAGVSCAAPLPFGTVIEVDGIGIYTVQDRTAKWVADKYENKVIDIYFDNHEAACDFGLRYADVYVKGGKYK